MKNGSFSGSPFCVEEMMSGNRMNSIGRNIELRMQDETDFSQELSVPAQDRSDPVQSDPAEEDKKPSIQDPAAQQHLRRYPMAVCDPEERWVREYIEQTGEEPGFF